MVCSARRRNPRIRDPRSTAVTRPLGFHERESGHHFSHALTCLNLTNRECRYAEDYSGSLDVRGSILVGVGEAVETRIALDTAVCAHANRSKKISFKRRATVRPVDFQAAAVGTRFLRGNLHCFQFLYYSQSLG